MNKYLLVLLLIFIPFANLFCSESVIIIRNNYNENNDIKKIVENKLKFTLDHVRFPAIAPIPEEYNSLIKKQIINLRLLAKNQQFGELYFLFASDFTKLQAWRNIIDQSASAHNRFSEYYPSLEQINLKEVEILAKKLSEINIINFLPEDLIEMQMISKNSTVDELCQASFMAYMSSHYQNLISDLDKCNNDNFYYTFARCGARCILLGETSLFIDEKLNVKLFFY